MAESENSAELDYLVYAPKPGKGYTIRAKTPNVIDDIFSTAHKDVFSPYDETIFTDFLIEERVITKPSSSGPIYYSRIYKRQRLDELGRDGIVSTIVSMPMNFVSKGLGFKDVHAALLALEKADQKVPSGDIPKLKVTWNPSAPDADLVNMQAMVSEDMAKRLVSILSESSDAKAFVIFKAPYKDRDELAVALAKFLHKIGLEAFTVTSECPMETFLSYYSNVVVGEFLPRLKPNSGWKIVNLGGASKSGSLDTKNLDETIGQIYH